MEMRMPSVPLIAVDPYFSVWSRDKINTRDPEHWTGSRNAMRGTVKVDGESLCFLGKPCGAVIEQKSLDIDAMSTTVVYANDKIELTAVFTSPMLVTDLYYASRPVSYLELSFRSLDGKEHAVSAKVSVSEELVLNLAGEGRACSETAQVGGASAVKMGSGAQKVLWRCGDDVRIDWGYFYLAVKGDARTGNEVFDDLYAVYAETDLTSGALFAFAYDDIHSLIYFGQPVRAYWKRGGKTIEQAIEEALEEYDTLLARCRSFGENLWEDAVAAGGEKYAELLQLAYRQVMAAHKLAVDEEGKLLYISKECFSNGCAATVDVTYPSAPLFLYYNPELLEGMLRPVMRFAESGDWKYDYAPHDVGCYPFVNGQVYSAGTEVYQMPVEECGNMIILTAALCDALGSADFAAEHIRLLEQWNRYLTQYGRDPGNQLCTDDFAGHMPHNCNLSVKAIMGIAGYARILQRLGRDEEAKSAMEKAREYADALCRRAQNIDGSYRLAFDRPETFSLKYNAVWDRLWDTGLFPEEFYAGEIRRYKKEALPYGVPLDSREQYTKSDWLVWAGCLAKDREEFMFFAELLWKAYHTMRTRVPMTDWYYADTSEMCAFRHRSVQGGLFLKLLLWGNDR